MFIFTPSKIPKLLSHLPQKFSISEYVNVIFIQETIISQLERKCLKLFELFVEVINSKVGIKFGIESERYQIFNLIIEYTANSLGDSVIP